MTLGFLFGSKNFCKLHCVSWEVFVFARIRLGPLSGQVLHHDCISVIVSRCTTFTENFVICCNQITKICCTKYDSANTSSARSPCDFGPLADLAISVFREVSINTVFTQIRTSRRLWRWSMRRTCVWVSAFRNPVIHKILSEFLQPFWYVGMTRVSPYLPFHTFAWHGWRCHGCWGRQAWGRLGMINFSALKVS